MTDVRHFCDGAGCGERITADRTSLKVACGPLRLRQPVIDLCPACLGKLVALLSPTRPSTLEAMPAARNGIAIH